jgi:hypothetical protein
MKIQAMVIRLFPMPEIPPPAVANLLVTHLQTRPLSLPPGWALETKPKKCPPRR